MKVTTFPTNLLGVNCYVVSTDSSAIIVDPAGAGQDVLDFVARQGYQVKAIIDTHGHADHVAGNSWFKQKTGAEIWIHQADAAYLTDSKLNMSRYIGKEIIGPSADKLLFDGDTISLGAQSLQVIHTPGHTPGSICLYGPEILISGDTLFAGSVGRTDLPGGDFQALQRSLITKLVVLPDNTVVYPGHGPATTIGSEKLNNPFLL